MYLASISNDPADQSYLNIVEYLEDKNEFSFYAGDLSVVKKTHNFALVLKEKHSQVSQLNYFSVFV